MLRLHSYQFHRPRSVQQAADLLAAHPQDVMLIAGGTDVMPNMKHRLFTPNHVVGIKQLSELKGIQVVNNELVIGASETLTDISQHPLVLKHLPALSKAAGLVAGPQLRNMGTIGGNICLDTRCTYYNQTYFWRNALGFCLKKDGTVCHVTKVGKKCVAAHSADTPPVLMTVGAMVDLRSAEGTRSVSVADFFIADGIWNNVRKPNEIVTRVRIALPSATTRTAFIKMRQRQSIDFSLLSMGIAVDVEGDTIKACKIVVSSLGSRPRDVAGLDKVAVGQQLNSSTVDAIADRAYQQCHPLENIIVDPDWRRAMVPVYLRRAFAELL
jgi:4-hydroxybenzoyl-CoA reductase subunit beta